MRAVCGVVCGWWCVVGGCCRGPSIVAEDRAVVVGKKILLVDVSVVAFVPARVTATVAAAK